MSSNSEHQIRMTFRSRFVPDVSERRLRASEQWLVCLLLGSRQQIGLCSFSSREGCGEKPALSVITADHCPIRWVSKRAWQEDEICNPTVTHRRKASNISLMWQCVEGCPRSSQLGRDDGEDCSHGICRSDSEQCTRPFSTDGYAQILLMLQIANDGWWVTL